MKTYTFPKLQIGEESKVNNIRIMRTSSRHYQLISEDGKPVIVNGTYKSDWTLKSVKEFFGCS